MNSNIDSNQSIKLANEWAGRTVTISGVGGSICIDDCISSSKEKKDGPLIVKTSCRGMHVMIELAPGAPGAVAFRVVATDGQAALVPGGYDDDNQKMYLTNIMYGDELRQSTAENLSSIPALLADNVPLIVDFGVGRPTGETNFEGPGFSYCPMTIQPPGPVQPVGTTAIPNKLQIFVLETTTRGPNHFGVRSLFGTYWRSQHWDKVVSQSPHCLGDETWYFSEVGNTEGQYETGIFGAGFATGAHE